jgi:hypothetical protein
MWSGNPRSETGRRIFACLQQIPDNYCTAAAEYLHPYQTIKAAANICIPATDTGSLKWPPNICIPNNKYPDYFNKQTSRQAEKLNNTINSRKNNTDLTLHIIYEVGYT